MHGRCTGDAREVQGRCKGVQRCRRCRRCRRRRRRRCKGRGRQGRGRQGRGAPRVLEYIVAALHLGLHVLQLALLLCSLLAEREQAEVLLLLAPATGRSWRLQPQLKEAAAIAQGGCNRRSLRLQPWGNGKEAATHGCQQAGVDAGVGQGCSGLVRAGPLHPARLGFLVGSTATTFSLGTMSSKGSSSTSVDVILGWGWVRVRVRVRVRS